MNYIKHLTAFFNHIAIENSVNPTHISLYVTIFQSWNLNRFQNPVIVSRDEIMKASKIKSKATYHKYIKDLERLGYLEYNPSYNPYNGTEITVIDLTLGKKSKSDKNTAPTSSKIEQVKTATSSKNERTVPLNERTIPKNELPYIYNKTYINNKNNIYRNEDFDTSSNFEQVLKLENGSQEFLIDRTEKKEKKSSAKKKEMKVVTSSEVEKSNVSSRESHFERSRETRDEKPSLELVKEYFTFQENSEFEAERFFNYYSSNGWLIGGKSKMEDWKASARNWMLNTPKFSSNTPKNGFLSKENDRAYNLNVSTDKNYAEPL